jgi:AAA+ superfamily predicted ATPase
MRPDANAAAPRDIPDDRVRLIFTCCHPALVLEASRYDLDRSSVSNAVASARRRTVPSLAREQHAGELAQGLKALFDPRMPGRAATHA